MNEKPEKLNEEQFLKMLKSHDWNYRYADDNRVYNAGRAQEMNIENAMQNQPELKTVYYAYVNRNKQS